METRLPMMNRVLVPEILDSLEASDPEAIRSRLDLRRLDWFLGGSRWIVRVLSRVLPEATSRVCELGAGEGRLCVRLAEGFPAARVTGLDLQPRPAGLPETVEWTRGNFLHDASLADADVVIGSLILHHFSNGELAQLGERLSHAKVLIFSEPWRDAGVLERARYATPFVGRVTRHDMPASIRAGFRSGEIAAALGLRAADWDILESSHWQGVIRVVACRR